jgi:hypothetical protein
MAACDLRLTFGEPLQVECCSFRNRVPGVGNIFLSNIGRQDNGHGITNTRIMKLLADWMKVACLRAPGGFTLHP